MKKFVFFDPENNEHYFFDTLDEAKKALFGVDWEEGWNGWNDDISDYFVAEIKAVGDIEVVERNSWEYVGNARWKEVE